jgi:hypothetical protein
MYMNLDMLWMFYKLWTWLTSFQSFDGAKSKYARKNATNDEVT